MKKIPLNEFNHLLPVTYMYITPLQKFNSSKFFKFLDILQTDTQADAQTHRGSENVTTASQPMHRTDHGQTETRLVYSA